MPYHILIVDDDPYFRAEFRECMEEFDTVEAANGEEALRVLKRPHNIDLIILDEMMPGIKGTDLLKEIKNINPNIRTILLTGHSTKEIAVQALRAEATDFIEKPLNPQSIKRIKTLLLSSANGELDRSISGIKGKIEQAKHFAERNYNKKLRLEDVADEIALSPKYLSRIFKENTGLSFSDYKLKIRMNQAKMLLKETGDNIEEIAYKLGYQNPESFSKVFHRFHHCTPRQFRDKEIPHDLRSEKKEASGKVEEIRQGEREVQKLPIDEKHISDLERMAAVVSHELRHPLGVISTAIWNIKKKSRDGIFDNNIRSIEKMVEQSAQIVNNLLRYSHIQPPIYKSIQIKEIINQSIYITHLRFDQQKVTIIKEFKDFIPESIETDPVQLQEILTHILTNAYQAIPEDKKGIIKIIASAEDDFLMIQIKDNGKGIEPQDLQKVCEPFFTRKHKGTGLGLSICQQIIHLHHGTLDITSQPDKGTTVIVRLPFRNPSVISCED
jgi:signal transduction histidine kinase/DNA-binding response OmpR family regulator